MYKKFPEESLNSLLHSLHPGLDTVSKGTMAPQGALSDGPISTL